MPAGKKCTFQRVALQLVSSGHFAPREVVLSEGLPREGAGRPGSRLTSIGTTAETGRLLLPRSQRGKEVTEYTFTQDSTISVLRKESVGLTGLCKVRTACGKVLKM